MNEKDARSEPTKSNWDEALEQYRRLEEEGRLDEIEPIPDEVHERVKKIVGTMFKERDL